MAELQITISSAQDLKNVNWRHGDINPYAVVWVDPKSKLSTKVDDDGDTCPTWDETLVIPLTSPIEHSTTLSIDIVHAYAAKDTKPLIGSARISIHEIVDEVGAGEWAHRSLKLKRPSGRPHGRLEVDILVREPRYRGAPDRYRDAPDRYRDAPYGVSPNPNPNSNPYGSTPAGYRDAPDRYYAPPYGVSPNPNSNPYASTPAGYSYNQPGYGQETYGTPGYSGVQQEKKSSSKFGLGTGLAVGAIAGVLGGVALVEGVDYVEDKITDDVDDRVQDDLGYDEDDF